MEVSDMFRVAWELPDRCETAERPAFQQRNSRIAQLLPGKERTGMVSLAVFTCRMKLKGDENERTV